MTVSSFVGGSYKTHKKRDVFKRHLESRRSVRDPDGSRLGPGQVGFRFRVPRRRGLLRVSVRNGD